MKLVWQNVLVLISFASYNYLCFANDKEKEEPLIIGGFFDEDGDQAQIPLRWAVENYNIKERVDTRMLKLDIKIVSKTDCFNISKTLCDMAKQGNGLVGIFGPQSTTTAPMARSIATALQIPHIQTNWRHSAFYSEQETVVNFYPDPHELALGLSVIVKSLQWNEFTILYENEDGLVRMQEILKLKNYGEKDKMNRITVWQLIGPGEDYRGIFKEIKSTHQTQFILDCETDHILPILQQAKEMGLLTFFHKYFLTCLDAHTVDLDSLESNTNITTVRIFDPESNHFKRTIREWQENENVHRDIRRVNYLDPYFIKTETALMYDAASSFINSVRALQLTATIQTKPLSCDHRNKFYDGLRIFVDMVKRTSPPHVLTAPIQFNHKDRNKIGQRSNFLLYLIQGNRNLTVATWSPESPGSLNLTESGSEKMGKAILHSLRKEKIIVVSRLGEPYLMKADNPDGKELVGKERYKGYSRDLMDAVARIVGFEYDFKIVVPYGDQDPVTKKWNGIIGNLVEHEAHLGICDLTVTPQRSEVVDFSMPFMTLGISILYTKEQEKDSMFAFLDPFSTEVWIYTATLYLTVSMILFFIARMAPGDWENPHPCEQNPEELENIWDLKNGLWLTLGSIMTQGSDILPKGISSRMTTSMWWFFSLIMTSSYTANLAAVLTTTRMDQTFTSAEELAKQTKIKYGVMDKGSTQTFFRTSNYSTYHKMWETMVSTRPTVFADNNERGVEMVRNSQGQYAFLMESSQIEYEVERKCDLKQVGAGLDSKTYAIAMPLNSGYRSDINEAVLELQESNELQNLKKKWWKEQIEKDPSCAEKKESSDSASSKLVLANVGGIFLVLGAGMGIAFFMAIIDFLWNVKNIAVEEHMTYWQALRVELIFALKVWITKKKVKPHLSESSSSHSDRDARSVTHNILHNATSILNLKGVIGNKRSISRDM